jgi:predicted outer membrane protein
MDYIRKTDRRRFLKLSSFAALGMGLGLSGLAEKFAYSENKKLYFDAAMTESEYRTGIIGTVRLSLLTSEIAAAKASDEYARGFAEFELEEMRSMDTVLKDMGTPEPVMDEKSQQILSRIQSLSSGRAFDREYITAQVDGHRFLRDYTESYLNSSPAGTTDMHEKHGQHLAMIALSAIKEHTTLTTRIMERLA